MKTCIFGGCANKVVSRSLCGKHYAQERIAGRIESWAKTPARKWIDNEGVRADCAFEKCLNPAQTKGWCNTHYQQSRRGAELTEVGMMIPCPRPGCNRVMAPRGDLCKVCNQLRWRYGLTAHQTLDIYAQKTLGCSNPSCGNSAEHLDHDHACCPTGKFPTKTRVSCGGCVRGWLCQKCNTALGFLQDDVAKLEGLVTYLKRRA